MQILRTDEFDRNTKKLLRKHRRILDDIQEFVEKLESGERPGYQLKGVEGRPVRWARLRNRSAKTGASGGFRVVYYFDDSLVLLLTIDSRASIDYVAPERILRILNDAGLS